MILVVNLLPPPPPPPPPPLPGSRDHDSDDYRTSNNDGLHYSDDYRTNNNDGLYYSDDYRTNNDDGLYYSDNYDGTIANNDHKTVGKIFDNIKAKKDHYHHQKTIRKWQELKHGKKHTQQDGTQLNGAQLDEVGIKTLTPPMNSKLVISEKMPRIGTKLQSRIDNLREMLKRHNTTKKITNKKLRKLLLVEKYGNIMLSNADYLRGKLKRYDAAEKGLNRILKRLLFLKEMKDERLKTNTYFRNEYRFQKDKKIISKESQLEASRKFADEGTDIINDENINDGDRQFDYNFNLADEDGHIYDKEIIDKDEQLESNFRLADEDEDKNDEDIIEKKSRDQNDIYYEEKLEERQLESNFNLADYDGDIYDEKVIGKQYKQSQTFKQPQDYEAYLP